MTTTYKIAAIPGDGIGAEVIDAGLEVLDALCGQNGEIRLAVDRFGGDTRRHRRGDEDTQGATPRRASLDRSRG